MSHIKYKAAKYIESFFRFKTLIFADYIYKNIKPNTILERKIFGYIMQLDVSRSNVQRLLYFQGERFIPERKLIFMHLNNVKSIVDVGSNIGYYALMFARYTKEQAQITCIEPVPDNFKELQQNIKLNNLPFIKLYQLAAGSGTSTLKMSNSINGSITDFDSKLIHVDVVTLDSIIDFKVDFMKIDVEGYEYEVLKGSRNIISNYHPTLFIELHPHINGKEMVAEDVYNELRMHYKNIRFYQKCESSSVFKKVVSRYFHYLNIYEMKDVVKLLSLSRRGAIRNEIWMTCC